jgi:hypothetical protein
MARRFQEILRPQHVRLDEHFGPDDAPIHVALGGEVDHRVEPFREQLVHKRPVPDPAAHEAVVSGSREVLGVLQPPGVGEGVEVHPFRLGSLKDHPAQKVTPDEPAAPGDEHAFQIAITLQCLSYHQTSRTSPDYQSARQD